MRSQSAPQVFEAIVYGVSDSQKWSNSIGSSLRVS